MEKSTISCFSSLIYLENFFCVNRSYLITDRRWYFFGNFISILTFSAIIIAIVDDVLTSDDVNINEKSFQGVLAVEFLILLLAARYRNIAFAAFRRLDEKCGADEKYIKELKRKVHNETIISVFSVIIDMVGMFILKPKTADILISVVMFSAHEAEMIFFGLMIEGMNLRLLKLVHEAMPSAGSRVYRHVLMASSQMNIEFTPRIMLMLGVILFTTVSYTCAILLMLSAQGIKVAIYLLWREMKSMYCMWRLCRAAFESDTICQKLGFQLAQRLAFDPAFDKAKNPKAYAIIKRWYTTVLQQKPRYVRGSVFSLGLSIPLHLVDISINYVLIIIQIYVAYK